MDDGLTYEPGPIMNKMDEGEKKFRKLVWDMQVGVLLQGPQAEILMCNPAALELLGLSEDQLIGKTSFDPNWNVVHEDGLPFPGPTHPVPIAISEQRSVTGVVMGVFRPSANDRVWLLVDAIPQFNDDGTIQQVVCTFINITERKQAQEILQKSEERYALTLDAVNDGFWDWNVQSGNAFFSPNYYSMLEYDDKDFVACYASWRLLVHPDDLSMVEDELQQSIENGKGFTIDLRMKLKSGNWKWVSTRGKVVEWSADKKALRVVGTLTDLSERKLNELTILQQTSQLKNLNSDKDRFISILAHDLKSPFNTLLGYSALLAKNIRRYDLDKIENQAKCIHQSAVHIYNLLEDILLWAIVQSGKMPYEPQMLDFSELCEDIFEILNENAISKNIKINHFSAENVKIYGDIRMLRTVLRNLLSNAIKFTNSGGQIDIYAEKEKSGVLIMVSDNGIGIEPNVLSKLFDISQIYTSTGTAKETGTGFGLLLCKEFIEKHGGKIWVESKVGKGTEFKFILPLGS
jgi:PAS domain S-box-containing protein